ncbi:hypothetical protein IID23_02500, partial [Patescibacteria group bacterium]|nr:hypothetical protein [Patescibacteria group bacterium]
MFLYLFPVGKHRTVNPETGKETEWPAKFHQEAIPYRMVEQRGNILILMSEYAREDILRQLAVSNLYRDSRLQQRPDGRVRLVDAWTLRGVDMTGRILVRLSSEIEEESKIIKFGDTLITPLHISELIGAVGNGE